jgi:hypothetical protein
MKISRLAFLFFSLLALSSCDESHPVYKQHCKTPPPNWATEADHKIRIEGSGVVSPNYNVINLDQTGSLNWNGYIINKKELTEYLHQSDSLDPAPMIILRIDDLTPCNYVEDVRKLMMKSATCQRPEKLCTEDNPEPEPPPSENQAESVQKSPSD